MTLKEKPLIDAGSKGAGVPDFFFATPFFSGFFGMVMAAFFGGVCFGFPGAYFAGGENESFVQATQFGCVAGLAVGLVALGAQVLATAADPETRADGAQFFAGGIVGLAFSLAVVWFGAPAMIDLVDATSNVENTRLLPRH